MRRLRATTLVAAFALSACSGSASPTTIQGPTPTAVQSPAGTATAVALPPASATQPSSSPSAKPTPTTLAHAPGVTRLEEGCRPHLDRCEDLAAGTYETSGTWAFLRGLTVTLPAGWSSREQDAGEFELHQASDPGEMNEIYFWRDLVAWVDGVPKPELGTSAHALAAYLLSDPRITVQEGPSRTFHVAGPDPGSAGTTVKARSFSVIVSESAVTAPGTFSDCPEEACIGIVTDAAHWDGGTASLTRSSDDRANQALRIYVASIGRELHPHTFVMVLSTYGVDPLRALAVWETQVAPIVDSVLLPNIVVDN